MINTARLLVENYRNGNTKHLDDITWHIVININPDGYEYTWTGSRFCKNTDEKLKSKLKI